MIETLNDDDSNLIPMMMVPMKIIQVNTLRREIDFEINFCNFCKILLNLRNEMFAKNSRTANSRN